MSESVRRGEDMEVQKLCGESTATCGYGDDACHLDAQRQPLSEEERSFVDAYEKGGSGEDGQEHSDSQDRERKDAESMPSPASLMESLFAGRMTEPSPTAAPEAAPVGDTDGAMDKLVERILVAESARGEQEVRITLGEGMLKGAELSIMRHVDGQLFVRVSCMDAASFQTAVEARLNLTEALESRGERVQVVVDRGDAGGGNEGDSRRRSQGLQAMTEDFSRP